nr:hypothetical protein [Tanacetum cinerariifolium]
EGRKRGEAPAKARGEQQPQLGRADSAPLGRRVEKANEQAAQYLVEHGEKRRGRGGKRKALADWHRGGVRAAWRRAARPGGGPGAGPAAGAWPGPPAGRCQLPGKILGRQRVLKRLHDNRHAQAGVAHGAQAPQGARYQHAAHHRPQRRVLYASKLLTYPVGKGSEATGRKAKQGPHQQRAAQPQGRERHGR